MTYTFELRIWDALFSLGIKAGDSALFSIKHKLKPAYILQPDAISLNRQRCVFLKDHFHYLRRFSVKTPNRLAPRAGVRRSRWLPKRERELGARKPKEREPSVP